MLTANVFRTTSENHYNIRNHNDLRVARTVYHGTESTSYLGLKIWDVIPTGLKQIQCLNSFEKLMRKWVPNNCPCRL